MTFDLLIALIRTLVFVLLGGAAVVAVCFAADEIAETLADRRPPQQPAPPVEPGRHRADEDLTQRLPLDLTEELPHGVA